MTRITTRRFLEETKGQERRPATSTLGAKVRKPFKRVGLLFEDWDRKQWKLCPERSVIGKQIEESIPEMKIQQFLIIDRGEPDPYGYPENKTAPLYRICGTLGSYSFVLQPEHHSQNETYNLFVGHQLPIGDGSAGSYWGWHMGDFEYHFESVKTSQPNWREPDVIPFTRLVLDMVKSLYIAPILFEFSGLDVIASEDYEHGGHIYRVAPDKKIYEVWAGDEEGAYVLLRESLAIIYSAVVPPEVIQTREELRKIYKVALNSDPRVLDESLPCFSQAIARSKAEPRWYSWSKYVM